MSLQLTRATMRALAVEGCHTVMAGGTLGTGRICAVVDVFAAVVSRPAVHAHAVVAAHGVEAGAPVLAGVWHQGTFVDVLQAELTCKVQSNGAS